MWIDIGWKAKTDSDFQGRLFNLVNEIVRLEAADARGGTMGDAIGQRLVDIMRLCDYNAGFLVPYFFPQYPYSNPLSLQARPFAFSMFDFTIGGTRVYRGSRQIGKSTSMGARQLIHAHLLPKYRSMYVAPHPSFLDTYANRLQELERAFRFPVNGNKYRQNLKYKEYPNGAVSQLVKCLSDASDARSKTSDCTYLDETDAKSSVVRTYDGEKNILDVAVGDRVLCFDAHENIGYDTVTATISRGVRHTWRANFSDGSFRECTGSSRFYTNRGWVALCEFLDWDAVARDERTQQIKTLLTTAAAVDFGDSSWRREHEFLKAAQRTLHWYLQGSTRGCAAGLLRDQGSLAGRVCGNLSTLGPELRVGEGELRVLDAESAGLVFYSRPLLPPESREIGLPGEDGNARMAGPADMGGDRLVVPRRRGCGSEISLRDDQHAQLPRGAGAPISRVVDGEGDSSTSSQSQEGGQDLLGRQIDGGGVREVSEQDAPLCAPVDALQVPEAGRTDVLLVRHTVPGSGGQLEDQAVLPQPRMPAQNADSHEGALCAQTRTSAETLATPEGWADSGRPPAQERVGSRAHEGPRVCGEMGNVPSELRQSQQGSDQRETPLQTEHLETSHTGAASASDGAAATAAPDKKGDLVPVRLISIEYAGEQEVYDIETEKHHTFFANGIAVHNCQLLDANLLPDIEQCQKASQMPMTVYAGTSTTTDSLLEVSYQESSRGAWHIYCGCGEIINCGDKEKVVKIIQPEGPMCPRCSGILDVTNGTFLHEDDEALRKDNIGFHIPQVIIGDYANNPVKWAEIYKAFTKYSLNKFLEEILGIPSEEGARELTTAQLQAICDPSWTSAELKRRAARGDYYKHVVSGCDWGGSDYNPASKTKLSYTVHAMLGVRSDGFFDIIHFRQYAGMAYREVVGNILEDHCACRGDAMASDFGVGALYNLLLRESGKLLPDRHMILGYTGPKTAMLTEAGDSLLYNHYSLNRTESITQLYDAIRVAPPRIRCFNWAEAADRLLEFQNLIRTPVDLPGGQTTFKYTRAGDKVDDSMHAVNFAYIMGRVILGESLFNDRGLQMRVAQMLNIGGQRNPILPGLISG